MSRTHTPRTWYWLKVFLRSFFSHIPRFPSAVFMRRLALGAAVVLLSGIVYVLWTIRDLPTPAAFAEREVAQITRILDREGKMQLYDVFGQERRKVVWFADIAPNAVHATLATEDDQFFRHIGIDLPGVARSFIRNILARKVEEGGSTITQQLVRNSLLTTERTIQRKIREIVLSLELEFKYSKEEILEAYLNQIPYGSNIYGVEAAAEAYFGKSAKELSLAQAAILASLPKAPSYFSPWGSHQEELLARKDYVLARMRTLGYINEEELRTAQQETVEFKPPHAGIRAPHFVFFVREELERLLGKDAVERGGFTVTTTLDWNIQQIAEEEIVQGGLRNEKKWGAKNAALTAIDPKTGEILAMVGSRDYFDVAHDGNVNVTIRPRQPGSSFKPIVYATAFERGFTTETMLFDVATQFAVGRAKPYAPQNYDGNFRGPVTARQALGNSLNVPSVKMLYLAGVERSVEMASRLGMTTLTEPERYGLSLVLGGGAVTLLEETAAFGVFANDGVRVPTGVILKIEDAQGRTVFHRTVTPERVVDEEIARQVTDILSDNEARSQVFGPSSPLVLGIRPVAAKTGTNQDYRDGWTVGYTPSFAVGVWVGNNDNSPMRRGADGVAVAAPIWKAVMQRSLQEKSVELFRKPKPIKTGKPILDGVWAVEERVLIDRASGKRATNLTPPEWIEERVYRVVHDTLFWVDKNDPRGAAPQYPENDSQFAGWEHAVQTWIAQDPSILISVLERPPEQYDDIHVQKNIPQMKVEDLWEGKTISNHFSVTLEVSAPLGVGEVVVFFDGEYLGQLSRERKRSDVWKGLFFVPEETGSRVITIKVFDVYGNRAEETFSVQQTVL